MKYNKDIVVPYIVLPAILLVLVAISYLSQEFVWKDNALYMILARRISSGHGFSDPVPYLLASPLYPIVTGLVSKFIFGNVIISGRLISSLLWITTGILLYRYLRNEQTRHVSTLGVVIWASITFPAAASLMTEVMYTFFIFTVLLSAQSIIKNGSKIIPWMIFSFSGVFAFLTRPEGVWFYCLSLVILTVMLLHISHDRKKLLVFVCGSLTIFMTIASPYIFHIHSMTGEWSISGKPTNFSDKLSNKLNAEPSLPGQRTLRTIDLPNLEKGYSNYHLGKGPGRGDNKNHISPSTVLRGCLHIMLDTLRGVVKILGHILRKFSLAGLGLLIFYLFRMYGYKQKKNIADRYSLYIELAFLSALFPVALLLPKYRIIYPYLTIVAVFCLRGFVMVSSLKWKRILWIFLTIHCIYLTTNQIVHMRDNSKKYAENIIMAKWISTHFPDISEAKMLASHAGVSYYAGTDYYRIVYLDSIQELTDFMQKCGYKYLLLNVGDTLKRFPPYAELLEPDGNHGNLIPLHREKGTEEILFFKLG